MSDRELATNDEELREKLAGANREHLQFIKDFGSEALLIHGVNPIIAYGYELIQVLNDDYLRGLVE